MLQRRSFSRFPVLLRMRAVVARGPAGFVATALLWAAAIVATPPARATDYSTSEITKVVMLGSGTPVPHPERSGPAVAVVVNGTPYLFDAGVNVVRQAQRQTPTYGGSIPGLAAERLNRVFLTHLHSDHTLGLPDLLLTPWTFDRDGPLQVYGPEGTRELMDGIHAAWRADIDLRLYGAQPVNNLGWRSSVTELSGSGPVYADENVEIGAIAVRHGSWPVALAYRIKTPDRVIVLSGDNADPDLLLEATRGADLLIHEIYGKEGFGGTNPLVQADIEKWSAYMASFHTRTDKLAAMVEQAKPKLLVLYHEIFWSADPESNADEIRALYGGRVISSKDGDIF